MDGPIIGDMQEQVRETLERLDQSPPEERIAAIEDLERQLRAELEADDEE